MSRSILTKSPLQNLISAISRTKGDNLLSVRKVFNSKYTIYSPSQQSHVELLHCDQNYAGYNSNNTHYCRSLTVSYCGNTRTHFSTKTVESDPNENGHIDYLDCKDKVTRDAIIKDMIVVNDFISEEEEQGIFAEIEPYLKRLRYEFNHWDNAIHGYRETERSNWTAKNKLIIQRIKEKAFPPGVSPLAYVHVLDLSKEGYIKPHVDAIKFCGSTIAGISLLSSAVMRLAHNEDKTKYADVLLKQRSLYIMKNDARYHYTHEVLPEGEAKFKDVVIPRDRRISIICRNEASQKQ